MDVEQRHSYGLQRPTDPTERFRILVVGPTGAGKSSFIAAASNDHVEVGQGTESCTKVCKSYPVKYAVGEHVSMLFDLVDTPGFDDPDPNMNDLHTLKEIANYAAGAWGVIYVHPITESRLTASARLNVEVLKAMCGEHFYPHVVICTTMWNNQPQGQMDKLDLRRDDLLLNKEPFGDLIRGRAKHKAFWEGSEDPCRDTLEHFASLHPRMAILRDMKEQSQDVHKTDAGKVLEKEDYRQKERARQTSNMVESVSEVDTECYREYAARGGQVESASGSERPGKSRKLKDGIVEYVLDRWASSKN